MVEDFGIVIPRWAEFRVYTDRSRRHYFDVFIFHQKSSMHRFWRETNIRTGLRGSPRFEAVCRMWETVKVRGCGRTGLLGHLLFCHARLGAGIVSHEMTHATIHWARRAGIKFSRPDPRSEERVCHVQGYLVNQFWNEYYRQAALTTTRGGA